MNTNLIYNFLHVWLVRIMTIFYKAINTKQLNTCCYTAHLRKKHIYPLYYNASISRGRKKSF